jgi:hypothetical protein
LQDLFQLVLPLPLRHAQERRNEGVPGVDPVVGEDTLKTGTSEMVRNPDTNDP